MFNLNENNRIVMAQHSSDMRIGVNGMCGQVRRVGLDPTTRDKNPLDKTILLSLLSLPRVRPRWHGHCLLSRLNILFHYLYVL